MAPISMATEKYNSAPFLIPVSPTMVDAFPLPRHREKSCCSRSQCSHKKPRLIYPRARSYSVTKNCIELMRAILADIQRGAEQLQMSMTTNNYDGSRRFTSPHTPNVL